MSTMVASQPETTHNAEITPEELLAMPDGGHYELIDGELRQRKVSALSNLFAAEFNRIRGDHCHTHRLRWIFAADRGYRCFPWKPAQGEVRGPTKSDPVSRSPPYTDRQTDPNSPHKLERFW
jgi:hypothetical protein